MRAFDQWAQDKGLRRDNPVEPLRDPDPVAATATPVEPVTSPAMLDLCHNIERFFSNLVYELGEHARGGGTAIGAAVIAKRVALAHGLGVADHIPLPRRSREEQADADWRAAQKKVSRR